MSHRPTPTRPTIGVVSPYLGGFYFGDLLVSLHRAAKRKGFRVLSIRAGRREKLAIPLATDLVDAWITCTDCIDDSLLAHIVQSKKPMVCLAHDYEIPQITSLSLDNRVATQQATEYLIAKGHRDIVFTGFQTDYDQRERLEGYRAALVKHQLPVRPDYEIWALDGAGFAGGLRVAKMMRATGLPFTAVVASTDLLAIGFMNHLENVGLRVPEDVAIVGFDNLPLSRTTEPPLATIDQNFSEMARVAIDTIDGQLKSGVLVGGVCHVPPTFIPRASCGHFDLHATMTHEDMSAKPTTEEVDAHSNEIGIGYEVTKDLISADFQNVLRRMWVLAPYLEWACIGELNDTGGRHRELTIRDVLNLNDAVPDPLLGTQVPSAHFPPLEQLTDEPVNTTRFVTVVPVIFQEKWTVLAVTGVLRSERDIKRYPTLMHYIDLLGLALERSMLDEEAKLRETRFRELAERLEIVSRTSNDGIWEWGFAERRIEWNARFYSLLEAFEPQAKLAVHTPRGFRRLICVDDLSALRRNLRRHWVLGGVFEMELRLMLPGGAFLWLAVTGEAMRDPNGMPFKMVGSVRDISSLKVAQTTLAESEHKFSSIFNLSPVPLSLVRHQDGVILNVNDAWLTQFGFARDEVVGKTSLAIELWVDPTQRHKMFDSLHAFKSVHQLEARLRCKNGKTLITVSSARIFEIGKVVCFVVSTVDVTPQRDSERNILKMNTELEIRVARRTQSLVKTNAELAKAMETLQLATKELARSERMAALGSLVAGVAHELNTPVGNSLTVASTLRHQNKKLLNLVETGALKRSDLTSFLVDSSEGTELLMRSLTKATELVDRFKLVAVDQSSDRRRSFDLALTISEIVATLAPLYQKTPFVVQLDLAQGVMMDSFPGPLGQVLTNLLSNAIVHAFEGRDSGLIRVSSSLEGDGRVEIRFQDNGIGVPLNNQPRVFDPFFTTKLGRGGSGLGMNIVYNLVTNVLGGQINLQSTQGVGTTITIEIPLVAPIEVAGD